MLELPLAAATFVAAQPASDARLTVRSLAPLGPDADEEVTVMLEALAPRGLPIDYTTARALAAEPRRRWAAYVLGAFVVLQRERGTRFMSGMRLLVDSVVPVGKARIRIQVSAAHSREQLARAAELFRQAAEIS